jgi:hypothetical protein
MSPENVGLTNVCGCRNVTQTVCYFSLGVSEFSHEHSQICHHALEYVAFHEFCESEIHYVKHHHFFVRLNKFCDGPLRLCVVSQRSFTQTLWYSQTSQIPLICHKWSSHKAFVPSHSAICVKICENYAEFQL